MTASPPKPVRRRRWRRRLLWLAAALVLVRLLLAISLPWLADFAVKGMGLRLAWQSASLSLFGGSLEIEGLTAAPRQAAADAPPLLTVAHLAVDVDMLSLLSLPTLRLAAIDGARLRLQRRADGSLELPPELTAPAAGADAAAEPPKSILPRSLALPFCLRQLRLADLRCELTDPSLPAPHRFDLIADLTLTDLGDPDTKAQLLARVTSPQAVDQLRLQAAVSTAPQQLAVVADGGLRGLRPHALATWLQPFGIAPVADVDDADLHFELQASSAALPIEAIAATATLAADWRTDGEPLLSLPQLRVDCARFADDGVRGLRAQLHGLRAEAGQRQDGALQVLGFAVSPPATPAPASPPANAAPAAAAAALPFADVQLELRDCQLAWHAAAAPQPLDLQLQFESLDVGPFHSDGGGPPASLSARLHLPGLVETVLLRDGELQLQPPTLRARLEIAGVTLAELQPQLRANGVHGLDGADLQADIAAAADLRDPAQPVLQLALRDVRLAHAGNELVWQQLALRDVGIAAADHRLRIGEVAIDGPRCAVQRAADGSFELLGLRIAPPPPAAAAAAPAPAPEPPAAAPWQFELAKLRWRGAALQFTDAAAVEPVVLQLQDIELSIDDLVAGRAAGGRRRGHLGLRARLPDVCEQLSIDGRLLGTAAGLDAALQLQASELTLAALAPYLAAAGAQPTLQHGSLTGKLGAVVDLGGGGNSFAVDDLSLRDGDDELLRLGRVLVQGLGTDADGTRVASVELEDSLVRLGRDADGNLLLPGLRLRPGAPAATAATAIEASAPAAAAPAALRLDRLHLSGCELRWHDAAPDPAVALTAVIAVDGDHLSTQAGAAPAPLSLQLRVPGGDDQFDVDGTVQLDPARLAVDLQLRSQGLDGSRLQPYLPAGLSLSLRDGNLAAQLTAAVAALPQGGRRLACELRDVLLRDGDAELLAVPELRVGVARLDAEQQVFDIEQIVASGVRARLHRRDTGLDAFGLHFAPVAGPPLAAVEADAAPRPVASAAVADAAPPSLVPHLHLGRLDLEVADLEIVDDTLGADAVPLQLQARLHTAAEWRSNADDPMQSPPLSLQLDAAALPVCQHIELHADIAALAAEPNLQGALRLSGLDTTALLAVLPQLQQRFAAEMTAGELSARFRAQIDLRRRRALQFDLTRPLALTARVEAVQLRQSAGGPLLAGVDSIDIDAPRIDPQSGSVLVRSIDIATPALHAHRDQDGLHVFGLRVLPVDLEPVADQQVAPAPAPAPAAAPSASPADVTVDLLSVSGIDFAYTDATTDPVTVLPLSGLDIDVAHFSTRALRQPEPFRFDVYLRGGEVALPQRQHSSSLLAGILGSAAKIVTGGDDQHAMQQRPLLDELAITGSLQLHPAPTGQIQVSIAGLELQALQGLARRGSVDIADGIIDTGVTLDLMGERGIDVSSNTTFTYLSLSEPAGGPISTYLRLPAPLDTVLYVLRNDADEQRVPLSFHIDPAGVGSGAVATAAIKALGAVLTKAIASSPLRLAGVFTGALGLGGEREDLQQQAQTVLFAAGDCSLPPDLELHLQPLLELLRGDAEIHVVLEHALGQADVARAEVLANPSADAARRLAARLRQQRRSLQVERAAEAARAFGLFDAGQTAAAQQQAETVRRLDRRLGGIEQALRPVLQLLRADAERNAERRTRDASLQIADARLQALRLWLGSRIGEQAAQRIELRRPRFDPALAEGGAIVLTPKRRSGG